MMSCERIDAELRFEQRKATDRIIKAASAMNAPSESTPGFPPKSNNQT